MQIATFNINSIRGRLQHLLAWLAEARPDVVCLQELRIYHDEFPVSAIADAGYGALWQGQKPRYNGVAILVRGGDPIEVRRALPGDADDSQARYLEAAVNGVLVASLYAPNGNPQLARNSITSSRGSTGSSRMRPDCGTPARRWCWPAISTSMPTPADIYSTRSYDDDALVQPQSRAAFR
jgi:exodeoxyribonuclease-3